MRLKAILVGLCSTGLLMVPAAAQKQNKKDKSSDQRETVAKPLTDKQRKQQEARLRKELETPYKKWLDQDVGYIISDESELVDTTMTGQFRMTTDPSEKDALLMVPGAGLTLCEQMGTCSKTDRFNRTDGTHLGTGGQALPESMNEFSRLERLAKLQA